MSLFQNSVVTKYLKNQNATLLLQKWEVYKNHFLNLKVQEDIKSLKEEQYQGEFLEDLFVKILGYTKPASSTETKFNLTTEYKNVKDSKKADGAIIINDKVIAVIELKSTNTTDLGKIETQAFGYKNNQPDCVYVITSNFEKIRFYIDNAIEFLEFNLFQLTQTEFELLYLCLAYDNLSKGIAKTIKDESVSQEDVITKKLYKDYSLFKRELHQNLVVLNPQYEPIELFKKSQKLLDRFLFIFFAEDRNLLPTNLIFRINKEWQNLRTMRIEVSLYDRYKVYFNDLNSGAKVQLPAFSQTATNTIEEHQIFAYNGGLFKADDILDNIKIDDAVLFKHTENLSNYDFASEVDVNILGHIFENSLNELDEIKAQLEGETIDKTKTKRKKDGVFYTPKYITKYIVENTIGKLCEEKKTELQLVDEDYTTDKKRQNKTLQALIDKVETYRSWLLQLTICDPACGSGAFLNQALDFLIAEHQYIDELKAKLFGDTFVLSDVENSILENNLFGVDLNEESVEIAKLSLWLRTAQPNRKLNDLSGNIQCGNSLIDDVAIAGDKAFNWQQAFEKVFAKGGFDVIIGNPPYVKLETIKEVSEQLSKLNYKTFEKRGDLYVLFVEKGFDILKKDGIISFIMPNKWLQAGYGRALRSFFLEYRMNQLIDFGDLQIFEGATTYPCIFISEKKIPEKNISIAVLKPEMKNDFNYNISENNNSFDTSSFNDGTWIISSNDDSQLLERLNLKFKNLEEFINGESNYGIKFGLTEAFLIDVEKRNELIKINPKSIELIGSILRGRDLGRYKTPNHEDLDSIILAYFGSYKILETQYPALFNHIIQFEEKLKKRGQCNGSKVTDSKPFSGQHHWLELDNNPSLEYLELYKKPKIMYQKFQVKPCFIFDEAKLYCNDSMWIIPTDNKGLLAILNSKMGWWLISKYCTQIQNGYQLIWKYFRQIPIANTTLELAEKADLMLSLNKTLQQQQAKVINMLQRDYGLEKPTKKLETWYELSLQSFFAELAKAKIVLSAIQKDEVQEYFETYQKQAIATKNQIMATDKQIDAMVYELYGLSEEEIEIVENS